MRLNDAVDCRRARWATAVACTALLVLAGAASEASQSGDDESAAIRAFVASLEPDTRIDVRLKDGSRLRGRMVRVSDQALLLQPDQRSASPRSLDFAEIDSVLRRKQRLPLVARIGIGVGIYVASQFIIGAF